MRFTHPSTQQALLSQQPTRPRHRFATAMSTIPEHIFRERPSRARSSPRGPVHPPRTQCRSLSHAQQASRADQRCPNHLPRRPMSLDDLRRTVPTSTSRDRRHFGQPMATKKQTFFVNGNNYRLYLRRCLRTRAAICLRARTRDLFAHLEPSQLLPASTTSSWNDRLCWLRMRLEDPRCCPCLFPCTVRAYSRRPGEVLERQVGRVVVAGTATQKMPTVPVSRQSHVYRNLKRPPRRLCSTTRTFPVPPTRSSRKPSTFVRQNGYLAAEPLLAPSSTTHTRSPVDTVTGTALGPCAGKPQPGAN